MTCTSVISRSWFVILGYIYSLCIDFEHEIKQNSHHHNTDIMLQFLYAPSSLMYKTIINRLCIRSE